MNCDEDFIETCGEGKTLEKLDANCNERCQNELKMDGFCEYEMEHCVCQS